MNALIRSVDGRETPAPGRWTIAPGQPVAARSGRWLHRRQATGRTTSGGLLITDAGERAFQLTFAGGSTVGQHATTLTYQSISVDWGPGVGFWSVAGELMVGGRLTPARSALIYHGVFRSGPGAIAWLGWHLSVPLLHVPGLGPAAEPDVIRHLELSAELNADAPPDLTPPHNLSIQQRRINQR